MERRYVIIDSRKGGDIFTDIMAAETTEEAAISKLDSSWAYLTDREKQKSTMELAYMAVDGDEIIDWDSEGYNEAVKLGWDTFSGYTPIATREAV